MENIKNRNAFLITCVSCIMLLLVMCYFGINSSVKGTSASSTCSTGIPVDSYCCPVGYTAGVTSSGGCYSSAYMAGSSGPYCSLTGLTESQKDTYAGLGYSCTEVASSSGSTSWTCNSPFGVVGACVKNNVGTPTTDVPSDSEYVCFDGPAEGQYWELYGDYKDNHNYHYLPGVTRENCKTGGKVCGVDGGYGTWEQTSCNSAGYKWSTIGLCCDTSKSLGKICGDDSSSNGWTKSSCEENGYTWNSDAICCNKVETVTITFNSNGGSSVDSQTITKGSKATKPSDPSKSCYTFSGWYSDSGLTTAYDFNTAVQSNITLHAKWSYSCGGTVSSTTYTGTYMNESTTWDTETCETTSGSCSMPLPDKGVPTKTGYKFNGWGSSGCTSGFTSAQSVSSNKTWYACWSKNTTNSASSSSSSSPSPSSSNVEENPGTGQIAIFVVWVIAFGAIAYSVWYFRKVRES